MRPVSTGPDSEHDSSRNVAQSVEDSSGSMHVNSTELPELQTRRRLLRLRRWASEHKGEILWALLFAILFAVPAGLILDPPKHEPYKIAVVEYSQTDDDTQKMFAKLAADWTKQPPMFGDVPVNLELIPLQSDTAESAKKTAEDLVNDQHVLMVIGHLPSGLTEVSLPIYMEARPQVPYISTSASDDNLLVKCQSNCSGDRGFVPLIQPSPRNSDQAVSAVRFAILKGKTRFLIVTELDPNNQAYLDDMSKTFHQAIDSFKANYTGSLTIGLPPSEQQLRDADPDCILYAGGAGAAATLMRSLAGRKAMVIMTDSVIETRGTDAKLAILNAGWFTYPTDASDYNRHINVYGIDAISIAKQLINDLNDRGGDFRFRLRSTVHLETIDGARRSLVRVMEENAAARTWYPCESTGACVFDQQKRMNGLFHVWQFDERDKTEMRDVDGWHTPKNAAVK